MGRKMAHVGGNFGKRGDVDQPVAGVAGRQGRHVMTEQADSRRAELIAAAQERWVSALTDLGGRNTLLYYKDRRAGTLDLGLADPADLARFHNTHMADAKENARKGWRAVCDCSWQGTLRDRATDAQTEAYLHNKRNPGHKARPVQE